MEQHFSVYRHEEKYLLSLGEATCLYNTLSALLQHDRGHSYTVRSLYFDNLLDQDLEEKLLGINERKKYRFRIYHTNDNSVKLEIKNKINNFSHKETAAITRQDALAVIQGDVNILAHYQNLTTQRFREILLAEKRVPTALIEYQRDAFLCPSQEVRITFDQKISAARSDRLFDPNVPLVGLHSRAVTVLEIKYSSFLPAYIREVLAAFTVHNQSISKYASARCILY